MPIRGEYDILKVKKRLDVKEIRIGDDKKANITPKEKLGITTKVAELEIEKRFLTFVEQKDGYGFGVYVDGDEVEVGYGTREQFINHTLENGITVKENEIIAPAIDAEPINDTTIINLVNNIIGA